MKTKGIIFGLAAVTILLWWVLTASQSNYRVLEQPEITFTNVYITTPSLQRLSLFYQNVFGVEIIATTGQHLLDDSLPNELSLMTPGYSGGGPLLTLVQSTEGRRAGPLEAYDHGYAHLCFESDDVAGVVKRIQLNGGSIVSTFEDPYKVPLVYAKDPDGNVVEVHLPFSSPFTPKNVFRTLNSLVRTVFKLEPPGEIRERFLHVNINSPDWARSVEFYKAVLGTKPVGFDRDYKGEFLSKVTGVEGTTVQGKHIALPGYSVGGPTLEIFTYSKKPSQGPLGISDIGRVAVGFEVRDLELALNKVIEAGGSIVDSTPNVVALLRDIDGNLIQFRQNLAEIEVGDH